jgi:dihydropyrimidinase
MTTLIKNGTIITATDMYRADILVKNGIVSEIGREISKIASEIIDATDKWVLPGAIDVQTHLDTQRDNMTTVDDFETGTAAAAAGGTTTVIDCAEQAPGGTLSQALEDWKAKAASRSIIDYGFHIALSEVNSATLSEIPAMVEAGVTSFKISLDGANDRRIGDDQLVEFLQQTTRAGALACIHAENGAVIQLLSQRLAAEGRIPPRSLPAVRPPELEAEATGRVIAWAELAKAPVYLTKVSSAHAVEKVKAARDRGLAVYGGTCPQYLMLDSEKYEEPEGIKFYCTPPLRPSWHQEVLWKALSSGDLHVIGSDHAAFNYAGQKDLGKENFVEAPRGFPGVQERISILCSAASAGKISFNRMVELTSTMPAKLFGLFPRKGTLAVGSDADMIILDPKAEQTLSKSIGLSRADYSAYEGMRTRGATWLVIQRGKLIAREGKVMGKPGSGEYLSRSRFAGSL